MEAYLFKWLRIIEEMKNDNTYKTAWGRGIIECVFLSEYEIQENRVIIKQSDIATKMIKYYWNQTFFFGLKQGKNPVILKCVTDMISNYKKNKGTRPVPWNDVETYFLDDKHYDRMISRILSNARTNVCPRFKNVTGPETLDIYAIDDKRKTLIFNVDDIKVLKEYAMVLSKLLNYKWAQLLERFNTAPNIIKKVQAAAERKIRRQSLTKYRNILLEVYHNQEIRDFYTGEILDQHDIHIDHVIPWSYIYSDDIWNLVVTKSTHNLQKNNRPPTKIEIKKLNERNQALLNILDNKHSNYKKAIEYALENKLLDKLYINMKG